MNNCAKKTAIFGVLLAALVTNIASLHASDDVWTNAGAGKWENGTNWSLGVPPGTNDYYDNIFNGSTITIDATTAGSFPSTMTVNNVALEWPAILDLNNAGTNVPLHILGNLDLTYPTIPQVIVTNSALQVDSLMSLGINPADAGNFELDSGWATCGAITLGDFGNGDLNLNGGTLTVLGTMFVGRATGGSGYFGMSGGTFFHTNNSVILGGQGVGTFSMLGGLAQALGFQIGGVAGSQGSLYVGGGTVCVSSNIEVGNSMVTNPCSVTISTNSSSGTFGTLIVTNSTQSAFVDISGQGNTITLNGGLFQVDNLILTNGGSFIDDAGTLIFTKPFQVENGSGVSISGVTITTTNNFTLGTSVNSTGTVAVADGGTLTIANSVLGLGDDGTLANGSGTGIATITNGTLDATTLNLGSTAGGLGLLTLQSNGLVNISSNLTVVSGSLTVTSSVTFSGGSFIASNGMTRIGPSGNGLLAISGGSHIFRQITLGSTNGHGSGGFHFLGGYVKILGNGTGPGEGFNSNWILWEGGDLDGSGTSLTIADGNDSTVTIPAYAFNVLGQLNSMYVGYTAGNIGTFTQASASSVVIITDEMILGDCVLGAIGNVNLSGGTLYVTNTAHTANLDVRNGLFTLGPGATLVVDNLILTNECGHFINQGGTLIMNNPANLSPGLDADGDGQINAAELAAGTDPLNPLSLFEMTGVSVSNQDVWVSWSTESGHSYYLQANGNPAGGSFSNLFSSPVSFPGTGAATNTYVHTNGVAGNSRFYRVKLGP